MIYVYKANVKEYYAMFEDDRDTFNEKVSLLCEERKRKMDEVKQPKDKVRAFAAGMLLQSGLYDYLSLSVGRKDVGHRHEKYMTYKNELGEDVLFRAGQMKKLQIEYGKNGKPYLPDYPGIYFNISHSGDYVAVALSCHPVGIDVQEKREISDGLIQKYFTEKEKKSAYPPFAIFSGKESFIKFTGEGMSRLLSDFTVDFKKKTIQAGRDVLAYVRIQELDDGEYVICVCDKCRDIICW
ncbi:MAG: 4'-phosphopantetheinyl transferase superfamily protein [Lachnospiraceae bacterium]|nr:4'-phosphopantetheinyl transferase superfamily protein [Lachnospiraceae bacterium]